MSIGVWGLWSSKSKQYFEQGLGTVSALKEQLATLVSAGGTKTNRNHLNLPTRPDSFLSVRRRIIYLS
jgi:hypothetical protein